LELGFSL